MWRWIRPVLAIGLVTSLLIPGACKTHVYELELEPDGDGMQRKLNVYVELNTSTNGKADLAPAPEEELIRLHQVYGAAPETAGDKATFQGRFESRTPADIGGAGYYLVHRTAMGTMNFYVERFRGEDDIAFQLERMLLAADRIIDLLAGWLENELGRVDGFERLEVFVNADLRQDFKNLLLYVWLGDNSSRNVFVDGIGGAGGAAIKGTERFEESLVRYGLYLAERGYFDPENLEEILEILAAGGKREPAPAVSYRLLRHVLERKVGIDRHGALCRKLLELLQRPDLDTEIEEYLRDTPDYAAELARFQSSGATERGEEPPEPGDVFGKILEDLLIFDPANLFLSEPTRIAVNLDCPGKPQISNGRWQDGEGKLLWSGEILDHQKMPGLVYAGWSEPDEHYQKQRFGRVLLREKDLIEYVVWYKGLGPEVARRWDAFVESLDPSEDLRSRLESVKAGGAGLSGKRAEKAVELLTRALEREESANER